MRDNYIHVPPLSTAPAIDSKQITCGLFLDFSKTFDTVNHDVLLSKLYTYGIRGTPFTWFKSYLCNRTQFVKIDEIESSMATITCGVPQGIYYAIVYPYLTYGCVLWGNNYEAPLSQLVRLQNKVVRIINNVPLCDHITPHYVNLGLIKLPDMIKLYTCQLFYDHLINIYFFLSSLLLS